MRVTERMRASWRNWEGSEGSKSNGSETRRGSRVKREVAILSAMREQQALYLCIIKWVRQIEILGLDLYELYVKEKLVSQTIPIADPVKRNNLHLNSRPPVREKSSKQLQLSSLKNNCSLFSGLYIASQSSRKCWLWRENN